MQQHQNGRPRERGATKPRRAAAYVDELRPIPEARRELIKILTAADRAQERFESVTVFGISSADIDDRIRRKIALLKRHGTEVNFYH